MTVSREWWDMRHATVSPRRSSDLQGRWQKMGASMMSFDAPRQAAEGVCDRLNGRIEREKEEESKYFLQLRVAWHRPMDKHQQRYRLV